MFVVTDQHTFERTVTVKMPSPDMPDAITGDAPRVRDGDTLDIAGKTIRLAGIDAPEYHQICATAAGQGWPCGKAARAQLEAFALTGPVTCHSEARDRYGRDIAICGTVAVPDFGRAMVAAGFAVLPSDERNTADYAHEETTARAGKYGLWQGQFATPESWRQAHPR